MEEEAAAVVWGQAGLLRVPWGEVWCPEDVTCGPAASPLLHDSPQLPCVNGAAPRPAMAKHVAVWHLHCLSPQVPLLGCGYPTSSRRSILRTAHTLKDAETTSGSCIITHLHQDSHLFQSLQRMMKAILSQDRQGDPELFIIIIKPCSLVKPPATLHGDLVFGLQCKESPG